MSGTGKRVVVVGGGVIGASCAYFLARSGWSVTVVDSGGFGQGCSHANCGFISPSHVLPLASPGALRVALGSLFKRNSPLKVRARLDPAVWSWLYHFARRCNHTDMMEAGAAIQALLNSSRRLYQEIIEAEQMDCEWHMQGMLFVLRTEAGMEHFAHTDKLLRESFHVPAQRFDGAALTEREPALKPGLAGGWLYEGDAHLRPDKLMASWERVLKNRGVAIHERSPVQGLVRDGGRARAITTTRGEIEADAFVFATGALTPLLSRELGCRIPIQPGKGYSITMPRPARCPKHPLIFEEHRVAVTPMDSGYRLGSTMEFAGYDATLRRERLELLRESARLYLHEPYCDPVQEEWFGWRPMTYDGKPIIDRSPAWPNVMIAAGHNMLGVSMAPATGRLVAELLNEEKPHIDPAPYTVTRFN
jgi:D-amino-acid dehydrogenase